MKQGSVSLLEMCISSTVTCKLRVQKSKNIDFSGYCYNAFFISNQNVSRLLPAANLQSYKQGKISNASFLFDRHQHIINFFFEIRPLLVQIDLELLTCPASATPVLRLQHYTCLCTTEAQSQDFYARLLNEHPHPSTLLSLKISIFNVKMDKE